MLILWVRDPVPDKSYTHSGYTLPRLFSPRRSSHGYHGEMIVAQDEVNVDVPVDRTFSMRGIFVFTTCICVLLGILMEFAPALAHGLAWFTPYCAVLFGIYCYLREPRSMATAFFITHTMVATAIVIWALQPAEEAERYLRARKLIFIDIPAVPLSGLLGLLRPFARRFYRLLIWAYVGGGGTWALIGWYAATRRLRRAQRRLGEVTTNARHDSLQAGL